MKQSTAAIVLTLALLILPVALFAEPADPVAEYIQSLSLFTPQADYSVRELLELGKPVSATAAPVLDPFPYLQHRQIEVPEGIRLMVFVPHPDDEALAASGIIQRVLAREGSVKVVYVTNGDGYKEALRLRIKNARISPRDFIEYGKVRQEEAVQSLCELGLQPQDAVFLGFPDDGIDDLWESYWSKLKPFISPHTLFDRPYRKGMNQWAKYSGIYLHEEIARLLTEFSPDWVLLPDPRDHHPDHATTGVFVLAALQAIYQDGSTPFTPTQVLGYIVHFKDFPYGGQWAKEVSASGVGRCRASGKTLANAGWVALPLTSEEVEGKRRALLAHASQLQMLQNFFKYFLLPSEVFSSLNLMQVIAVPQEYAAYFKHPSLPLEREQ